MIAVLPTTADSGKPAGEALRHRHEIGLDPGVLVAEHPAGPPESGLHFVGDEHDAVPLGERAEALQERGGAGTKPPSPSCGSMTTAATCSGIDLRC